MSNSRIIEINKDNLYDFAHCWVKNQKNPGYISKTNWLKKRFKEGLRYKLLATDTNQWAGFIEYVPGDKAWRAVNAKGYMFIHCIWTYPKSMRNKGYGDMLISECIKDAKKHNMNGVAVATRVSPKGTFIANSDIFTKAGFTCVDTAPPDHELLMKKLKKTAANPGFPKDFDKRLKRYDKGLTIIWSYQCPYVGKAYEEILETARKSKIKFTSVELKTAKQAQAAPTPYAVFSVIHNGKVYADHMISNTRFKNILNQIKKNR